MATIKTVRGFEVDERGQSVGVEAVYMRGLLALAKRARKLPASKRDAFDIAAMQYELEASLGLTREASKTAEASRSLQRRRKA